MEDSDGAGMENILMQSSRRSQTGFSEANDSREAPFSQDRGHLHDIEQRVDVESMNIISPVTEATKQKPGIASRCPVVKSKEQIAIGVLSALVMALLIACVCLSTRSYRKFSCSANDAGSDNQAPPVLDSSTLGSPLSQAGGAANPASLLVSIEVAGDSAGANLFLSDSAEASWVVDSEGYAFAHEAPVWDRRRGELFFASNILTERSSLGIELRAISLAASVSRPIAPKPDIPMPNGATPVPAGSGPFPAHPTTVVAYQGYGPQGGGLAYLNTDTGETETIVASFPCIGDPASTCQLNSPNDVVFNVNHTGLWFTDPDKGFVQGFRQGAVGPQASADDKANIEQPVSRK